MIFALLAIFGLLLSCSFVIFLFMLTICEFIPLSGVLLESGG